MSGIMTPRLAVFNGHVNDASAKARAIMREIAPDKMARVEELEIEGNGIMYIFKVPPEDATTMFIHMVTALVNAYRVEV